VVELNRAVAVAASEGLEAGLEVLDRIDLDGYRYFHAARADLLRRLGRDAEAAAEYDRAIALTPQGPELRFLERRLSEVAPR
jgi:RNA polymerase sigma-70 factor (ECF subfamily)